MALLVGLTGSIGSGKSTVSALFTEWGGHVIDADAIVRDLERPQQPGWQKIVEAFGPQILQEDQTLDRGKLAHIVFHDPGKKKILEGILHPLVFEEEQKIYTRIRERDPAALVFVDAALLIESGNHTKMDKVIVITCDEETRIRRVVARSALSRDEVVARMRSQMSDEEKSKYADYVLENRSDLQTLRSNAQSVFAALKALDRSAG